MTQGYSSNTAGCSPNKDEVMADKFFADETRGIGSMFEEQPLV